MWPGFDYVLHLTFLSCSALIVLAAVFSMAWYAMATLSSGAPWHIPLVTCLKARVYTEKIQVTCMIFHDVPLESVA